MNLTKIGWLRYQAMQPQQNLTKEKVARVIVENRGGYLLYSSFGNLQGIVQGKFIREAKNEKDFPKVGDWVLIEKLPNEEKAIIKKVLPRYSKMSRKKAGEDISEQIIAANIDVAFIVQGLDDDFNLSRLERYVAMAIEGNCQPIILLNKLDLAKDAIEKIAAVQENLPEVKVIAVSAINEQGLEKIRELISDDKTIVFVGSSGVGKSTLVNVLLGSAKQKTQAVRVDDSRGRHTTTKRELFILEQGGILIDTPGMRELGLWMQENSLNETFEDIDLIAAHCKFNNCDHLNSAGCAVRIALAEGLISQKRYDSYLKLLTSLDLHQEKFNKKQQHAHKRSQRQIIKRPEFRKK